MPSRNEIVFDEQDAHVLACLGIVSILSTTIACISLDFFTIWLYLSNRSRLNQPAWVDLTAIHIVSGTLMFR